MEAIYHNVARLEAVLAQNDPKLLLGSALSPEGLE